MWPIADRKNSAFDPADRIESMPCSAKKIKLLTNKDVSIDIPKL